MAALSVNACFCIIGECFCFSIYKFFDNFDTIRMVWLSMVFCLFNRCIILRSVLCTRLGTAGALHAVFDASAFVFRLRLELFLRSTTGASGSGVASGVASGSGVDSASDTCVSGSGVGSADPSGVEALMASDSLTTESDAGDSLTTESEAGDSTGGGILTFSSFVPSGLAKADGVVGAATESDIFSIYNDYIFL
jgi:hypothetical protein